MSYYDSTPNMDASFARSQFQRDIALNLILTILTCGFYGLYWKYKQMQACNYFLRRNEFSFWEWFFFSIITCGIYHIYYQYKMGSVIVDIQKAMHKNISDSLPILSCVLSVFGLFIIVDCIHQHEINKFFE